ncbi:protein piccolo-like [Scylla paramamosain]|uniref:protein piccolo-like n=1 Tax=Scylla paramamosain TaxID=85552 RepID=UPI00308323C4
MDASHTLLLLLGWVLVLLSSVTGQRWTPPSDVAPKGGERLDTHHSVLPLVRFACEGRTEGYYGDMDFGCIVFHYCDKDGHRFSFKCDEGMKFNEVTTSCSAGYFGDCSHPQILGSARRDESTKSTNADSIVKIPGFVRKAEREGVKQPKGEPEPVIKHEDPALYSDNNYELDDAADQEPDASNRVTRNNNVKRSWDSPMMSALSAFASLANIPLDNSMLEEGHREGRGRNIDHVDRFDTVDRAFVAHPSPHRRTPHTQSNVGFMQLPFFQPETKKGRLTPQRGPPRTQSINKPHHRRPHLRPDAQDPYLEPPPRHQRPPQPFPIDPNFDFHSDDRHESVQSKPSAGFFRPSSLLNSGQDEFQPVTESKQSPAAREAADLIRPHRNAQGGSISTTFQNFSPGPSHQNTATRFPAQNTFTRPTSSSRPVQNVPTGFFTGSQFPSTGSFLFHQPPVPSLVSSRPFHHVLPSGTGFHSTPAPQLQQQDSFGFQHQPQHQQHPRPHPQPGQTIVRQTLPRPGQSFIHQPQSHPQTAPSSSQSSTQTFGRPKEPQPVHTFSFSNPRQPQPPPFLHGQSFTTQPSIFSQGINTPPGPPQSVQTFERPSTAPQPFNVFSLAEVPLPTTDSFERPSSRPAFSQSDTREHNNFGVSSPTPFTDAISESLDDFDFSNPELQQESPLSQKEMKQQQPAPPARRPSNPSTPSRTSQNPTRHPDSSFKDTPRTSTHPDPLEAFGHPLKERTRGRPVERPEGNQRQTTQRNPVSHVTEQQERRRPSRTRRPTRPLDPTPHTVQKEENQPFSHSGERLPQVPRLQPQPIAPVTEKDPFINPTPFTPHTQVPFTRFPGAFDNQPGQFQPSPDVFNFPTGDRRVPEGFQHLGNDIPSDFSFPTGVQGEELSRVEGVEEDTNVIQGPDGGSHVTDEEVISTTPSTIPDTTANTPPRRRLPNIRTRLRQRGSSRTTTPPDAFQTEAPVQSDYEYFDDSLVTTQTPATEETPTTTTTLSPFRQRIKDRLNRLKNRRRQSIASSTTTRQPSSEESPSRSTIRQPSNDQESVHLTGTRINSEDESDSDQTTTTVSPRRRLLRPRGFDRKRFQSFREKLRSRIRDRVATSETPHTEEDTTKIPETAEEEVSPSGGRARRLNRFRPRPAEGNEESVLIVKEILRSSDQDIQETTQLEVSNKPEEEQTGDHPEGEDSPVLDESFGRKAADSKSTFDVQEEGEANQQTPPNPDAPRRPGFLGRRLADPNIRARFREFLKNRKNKLSARYRTTEVPRTSKEPEQSEVDTEEQTPAATEEKPQWAGRPPSSHHDAERKQEEQQREEAMNDDAVLKERAERFEQRRKELRTKLLARRNEERLARRIPTQSPKNQVPSEAVTKDESEDPPPFGMKQESEDPPTRRGERPMQKVISIDGFRPIIETPPAPPTPLHSKPFQEPEIITAPPASEDDDMTMLIKVSANFGGKEQPKEVTKIPHSDLPPLSTMIVREIGTGRSTTPAPPSSTPKTATSEASSQDATEEDLAEQQEGSESQHAPVLLSVQTVPDKAPLHTDMVLALSQATASTTESPSPSSTPMTEAPTPSSPDSTQTKHVSKPSFNLAAAFTRRSNLDKAVKGDSEETESVSVTPVPHFAITMATGAPLLPLEMLLPLANSR